MHDGCPHHAHRHEAQRRLCDVVRRARRWTRSFNTDPRVDALLAAVVRSHAADTHGNEAECDAAVQELDALCRALEGPQPAPRYVPLPEAAEPKPPPAPPAPAPAEAVEGPLVAYTDGSGTQGHLPSGAGVVVYDGDEVVLEESDRAGPRVEALLAQRADAGRVTLVATNLDAEAFAARYLTERLRSRLSIEQGRRGQPWWCEVGGVDLRDPGALLRASR